MIEDETNNQYNILAQKMEKIEQSVKDLNYQVKFLYLMIFSYILFAILVRVVVT